MKRLLLSTMVGLACLSGASSVVAQSTNSPGTMTPPPPPMGAPGDRVRPPPPPPGAQPGMMKPPPKPRAERGEMRANDSMQRPQDQGPRGNRPPPRPRPGMEPGIQPGTQPGTQPGMGGPGRDGMPRPGMGTEGRPGAAPMTGTNTSVVPPRWNKGDSLPMDYRGNQYVIDDWKSFNLSAPPRGHRWVGVGADFYLVNASNGRIQDMMGSR
jgi:Ni/Co efflux regulator RcnB